MSEERTIAIDHLVLETYEELPGEVFVRISRHTLAGAQPSLTIKKGNEEEALAFLKPLADMLGVKIEKV